MVWGKVVMKPGSQKKELNIDDIRILDGVVEVRLAHSEEVRSFPTADLYSVLKGSPDGFEKKLPKRGNVGGLA